MNNTKRINKRINGIMIAFVIITLLVQILSLGIFADNSTAKNEEHVHDWVYEKVVDNETKEDPDNKTLTVTRECKAKDCPIGKQVDKVIKKKSDYYPGNGWMEKLAVPFGAVIRVFYNLIPVYAIALFLFAIAMKVVLFPFGIKQQKNMIKQAMLRPKEAAIRKKYAGREDKQTQQKVQQEIMELYQKENFNPASGCLPLLLQMPILFALFRVIYNPLRHTCGLKLGQISEIGRRLIDCNILNSKGQYITARDLSIGDLPIATLLKDDNVRNVVAKDVLSKGFENPDLTFLGIDLSRTPELKLNLLLIIPIATFLIVYFSSVLTRKLSYQPQQNADSRMSGCIMDWMMPVMSTWFTFMYPAVLGLYWMFQNILGVLQQFILKKMYPIPVFSEEDYKQAEKEIMGKAQNSKRKPGQYKRHPNSLHHIDDDDDDLPPVKKAENKPPEPKSSNDLIAPAPLKDEDDD